ncbi:hypothetical protein MKX08_007954 [Trichoderma sp. CBMAI-0020]|nr:hypothetical protein MKX08_007954 [Trichoderma sp. CBMAI-0020]WOD45598.1 hypothetical protein [Trichoderma atroviride]
MQAIGRVRLPRFEPTVEMLCARTVDLRPFLDMPRTHPESMTYRHLPMGQTTFYISAVSYVTGFDMSKNVMISSWANQESYKLNFELEIGLPHAIRRPRIESFQGLVYLMRKVMTGDIGAAICLNARDMDGLKVDAEFTKYTKSIV